MDDFFEIPPSEWKELVNKPASDSESVTVHMIAWREGKVMLVLNPEEKKSNGIVKPRGWGVPTGGVNYGETPFKGAKRELKEETGLSDSDFEISPMPFRVTKKINGHISIWFLVKVDSGVELPKEVNDPSGNITKKPEWFDPVPFFYEKDLLFKGEIVYGSHINAIKISADKEFEAVEV